MEDFKPSPGKMSDNTLLETICDDHSSKIMCDLDIIDTPDTIDLNVEPFSSLTMFEIINRSDND